MMRQLCVRNFSSSVSMALRHSGIVIASSYDLGIRGSLIIMKQRCLMKSQSVFSKARKLNSAWSIWPCLIFVLSFNARLYQYCILPSMSNLLPISLSLYLSGSSGRVSVNVEDDVYVVFMMYHMVRVKRDDRGRWYVRNRFLLDGRGKDELATQSICVVFICY